MILTPGQQWQLEGKRLKILFSPFSIFREKAQHLFTHIKVIPANVTGFGLQIYRGMCLVFCFVPARAGPARLVLRGFNGRQRGGIRVVPAVDRSRLPINANRPGPRLLRVLLQRRGGEIGVSRPGGATVPWLESDAPADCPRICLTNSGPGRPTA